MAFKKQGGLKYFMRVIQINQKNILLEFGYNNNSYLM